MGTLAALVCLCLQDDRFHVDGSPFLVLGDQVQLQAKNVPPDAVVVWRLADGPPGAIETRPALSKSSRVLKGPSELTVMSTGKTDAEFRFAVTAERKGVRLATAEFKLRAGAVVPMKVWIRAVDHDAGGTKRADLISDDCRRKALESEVNRYLRPIGVEASFEAAPRLRGADWWFDKQGRFQPMVADGEQRANSPQLSDLIRNDLPGGLNVYFVRDVHWEQVLEGFSREVWDWQLLGVGLKEGQAVVDDGADAMSLAHELGHALGLDDLKDWKQRDRLMFWGRNDRTDVRFTYGEMKDARSSAQQHRKAWARNDPALAAPRRR